MQLITEDLKNMIIKHTFVRTVIVLTVTVYEQQRYTCLQ